MRLRYLDGWRGLCIVAVLIGHFAPIESFNFGGIGVEMFFVLSGRLMADLLFIENTPLQSFFIRRFSRVWPGLFVYVSVCFLIFRDAPGFLRVDPTAALAALTFTTNYKVMLLGETRLMDHIWSLCVEEHSYLLLGILALACRKIIAVDARPVMLGGALLMFANGIIESILIPGQHSHLYWRSDIHCASVFFSAFVYLSMTNRKPRTLYPWWLTPGLCGLGTVMFLSRIPVYVHYTVGTICFALAVSSFERVGAPARRIFSSTLLIAFGTYSFSIYIWQQVFYKVFEIMRVSGTLSTMERLLFRPGFLVAACLCGVLSFYLVERPARRFINRRWTSGMSGVVVRPAAKANGSDA